MGHGVLFDVFPADANVFEQALSGMGASFLDWVFSTQSKHSHVLQGQQQFYQRHMELLSKDLTHLIAFIL